jgi:glycosyltransferase involved in cell wall biosynthesis
MTIQLSVIIPSKNRVEMLRESLQHLVRCINGFEVEVIVVNDGDDRIYSLRKNFPIIKIIQNPGSGVASARNTGARLAAADLLLFLDDDMWITEPVVERILVMHSKHTKMALNINWIYPPKLSKQIQATAFGRYLDHFNFTSLKGWNTSNPWNDEQCFETIGITSQNLSIRKETFLNVGGYNESFPHAGFEDYELSKRLVASGVKIFINPVVMMYHNEADRQQLRPWLDRKKRGGETRAVAVALGHLELEIKYSFIKKSILRVIALFRNILVWFAANSITDKFSILDVVTFKIINVLLAVSIFDGYRVGLKSKGKLTAHL